MYCCYKFQAPISEEASKFLFRCYTAYVVSTAMVVFLLMMWYDVRTRNGRYTILPNGHCAVPSNPNYSTQALVNTVISINKVAHIVVFTVYLYYTYKMKKDDININQKNLRRLHKIAAAMGFTVGLSAPTVYIILLMLCLIFLLTSCLRLLCLSSRL